MVFLADLSSIIDTRHFQRGDFSKFNLRNLINTIRIFPIDIILNIEKIIFLTDKNFTLDLATISQALPLGDAPLRAKIEDLLLNFDIIIYPKQKHTALIKRLNKNKIISVTDYAGVWYKEIYHELPKMELYDEDPRDDLSLDFVTFSNSYKSVFKIEDKLKYFDIKDKIELLSDKVYPKLKDYKKEIVTDISDDFDETMGAVEIAEDSPLMADVRKNYLNEFIDLLDLKTIQTIKTLKSYQGQSVFIYGSDLFLKTKTIDFLLHKKKVKEFEYDLRNGYPIFTQEMKDCQILVFKNLQQFSYQQQIRLWHTIVDFSLDDRFIIFEGNDAEDLAYGLREKFDSILIQSFCNYEQIITKLFFALVLQKTPYYEKDETKIDFLEVVKSNGFSILLNSITDIHTIYLLLKRNKYFNKSSNLLDVATWYRFLISAEKFKSIRPSAKNKKLGYFWGYKGDFWEISFNYEEPLLIENRKGMYYIAYMMYNQGKEISATELRTKIGGDRKVPEPLEMKNVAAIRKSIRDAIDHISLLEGKLKIGDKLSLFLMETFFPKKLQEEKTGQKPIEDYFKDTLDICLCKFPENIGFNWEYISTPIIRKKK